MHPLRAFLEEVAAALRSPAMRDRVQGNWDDPDSLPRVRLAPPASEAELRAFEARLGAELPPDLREVLGEVSADIEIVRVLRGHRVPADWGGTRVEITVDQPDEFRYWSHGLLPDGTPPPQATRRASYISGGFRLSLAGIERAYRARPGWAEIYDPKNESDPDTAEHLQLLHDFMWSGFPFMTAPNGDWLAIDLRDGTGCVQHVSHEGEEAGIEIDLGVIGFLTHLAWLGPVWPDFGEVFAFSDPVAEVRPGDYRIRAARFDAQSDYGTDWRRWYWGTAMPKPAPDLLSRCTPPIG